MRKLLLIAMFLGSGLVVTELAGAQDVAGKMVPEGEVVNVLNDFTNNGCRPYATSRESTMAPFRMISRSYLRMARFGNCARLQFPTGGKRTATSLHLATRAFPSMGSHVTGSGTAPPFGSSDWFECEECGPQDPTSGIWPEAAGQPARRP